LLLLPHLANHYFRSADVVLRGYSGCNTRWAARVAERGVASIPRPVRAVTVFFGANDAAMPDRQQAPAQAVVVILITPPPVDEDGRLR
ncbi:hypothetical protein EJB05_46169, partial [Eragrostis curvula]